MARSLAALKVTIGLKPNGQADYPDFNQLAVVQTSKMDWSHYIDAEGEGWAYDKVSGHKDDDADSPAGQQFGVLVVPETFVTEAVAEMASEIARIEGEKKKAQASLDSVREQMEALKASL